MASVLDNVLNDTFGPIFQGVVPLEDAIQVKVQGGIFHGWDSVSISKSIDSLASSFSLGVSDRWRDKGEKYPIMPGQEVKIGTGSLLSSELMITGFIEQFDASVSNEDRTINIGGRNKVADLIDSAAIGLSATYKNITLKAVAEEYAKATFKLTVEDETFDAETFKFKKVVVNQGETIFELLDRLAKERGVLLTSTTSGNLLITNRSPSNAPVFGPPPLAGQLQSLLGVAPGLFQGKNVLFADSSFDETDRFKTYLVKSQIQGDDFVNAKDSATINGTAFDLGVGRPRTKYMFAEKSMDNAAAKRRAEWESTNAAANASKANVVVQGWRDQAGDFWDVNKLVETDLTFVGFTKGQYLIRDVQFIQAKERGTLTIIGLGRTDSFGLEPEPKVENDPKRDSGWDPSIFGSALSQVANNLGF